MNILQIIFSFLAGIVAAMGLGGGSVLVIYLSAILSLEQKMSQGINLLFFIPCAVYSTYYYSKEKLIIKQALLPIIAGGVIGVLLGMKILSYFDTNMLSKMFGLFLIVLALKELKKK